MAEKDDSAAETGKDKNELQVMKVSFINSISQYITSAVVVCNGLRLVPCVASLSGKSSCILEMLNHHHLVFINLWLEMDSVLACSPSCFSFNPLSESDIFRFFLC